MPEWFVLDMFKEALYTRVNTQAQKAMCDVEKNEENETHKGPKVENEDMSAKQTNRYCLLTFLLGCSSGSLLWLCLFLGLSPPLLVDGIVVPGTPARVHLHVSRSLLSGQLIVLCLLTAIQLVPLQGVEERTEK